MGSLRPEIFAVINAYWSEVFGCAPHELWRGGTTLGTHHGPLTGYPGVYVLSARGTTRVSAPDHLVDALGARLASAGGTLREALLQADSWREWFGRAVTRVHGPSVHLYLDDPGALDDAPGVAAPDVAASDVAAPDVRRLTEDDGDAEQLDKLRAACAADEWNEGGFAEPAGADRGEPGPVLFGAFRDGVLVAAANLTAWRDHPSDVGLLTHPEHRGTGLATRLAVTASRHALDTGGLVRYRALVTNRPSLAIARRLGYQEFGRNLAVRLEL
jgi:RimJ/RimL family protein N-acetyltransferase